MDNYKIKVNDEAESKEAQKLFFELGYVWADTKCQTPMKFTTSCIYSGFEDGELCRDYYDENPDHQELTIPQLRELVVLKRNDVKDATHEDQYGDKWLYLDERHYVYLNDQWDLPIGEFLERYELKPIEKSQPQDPALISGAEALRALADGKDVQVSTEFTRSSWHDDTATYTAEEILAEETAETDDYNSMKLFFRLKPQTIKVELEIPAPYKAKIGGRDDTSFVLSVGRHQYCYNNEEDYTKARDALEAVFDAAVRGTNS